MPPIQLRSHFAELFGAITNALSYLLPGLSIGDGIPNPISEQKMPMRIAKRIPSEAVSLRLQSTLSLTTLGALLLLPPRAHSADLATPQGATLGTVAPSAAAEEPFDQLAFVTKQLAEWKVVLGGGAMIAPKYEGSDEYEVSPVPFVSAVFGDTMRIDPRGASFTVYKTYGVSFGVRVGYDLGRSEDDSDHLRGLGDIDAGAVLGGRIAYDYGPFEAYATLDRIIGGSDGLQSKFGVDLSYQFDKFLVVAGVSGTWSDSNYMESYFGVTPLQSALSGLPAYDIGAGIKRVDVQASVTYQATEHWLVRGQAGLGYLVGDAADSPIVESETQPFGLLSVGYRF